MLYKFNKMFLILIIVSQTTREQNMDEMILNENKKDEEAITKRLLELQNIEDGVLNERKELNFKRKRLIVEKEETEQRIKNRSLLNI